MTDYQRGLEAAARIADTRADECAFTASIHSNPEVIAEYERAEEEGRVIATRIRASIEAAQKEPEPLPAPPAAEE